MTRESIIIRVPPDAWYLPVTRAVATEIAAQSGLGHDGAVALRTVTTEVATALCLDAEQESTAELEFTRSARGVCIVGKVPTQQTAPPEESTPLMRLLRQVAGEVTAVCVVDSAGQHTLRLAATICLP
ncbi:MAG TPA: hypothetical protein VFJ14_10660 [Nocardioidaceae bacterium]|nr:hypothetical protein [Nocardioidaceae bacterium]